MNQHFFGANLDKVCPLCLPVRQYPCAVAAVGFGNMRLDQVAQLRLPMGVGNGAGDKGFKVHEIFGHAHRIVNIGHPARHARAKVCPDPAQHHGDAAGHIFTPVRPTAFNHHRCARVAHGKTFARAASGVKITRRRPI